MSRQKLNWCFESENLLDRGGDELGRSANSATQERITVQRNEHVGKQIRGRLVTRHKEVQQHRSEFLVTEPAFMMLIHHERRDEIVCRFAASLRHDVIEVVRQVGGVVQRGGALVRGQHRLEEAGELIRGLSHLVAVMHGYAEKARNDQNRQWSGEVCDEIEGPCFVCVGQKPAGNSMDLIMVPTHTGRSEGAAHEPPQAGMPRWVVEHHRGREARNDVFLIVVVGVVMADRTIPEGIAGAAHGIASNRATSAWRVMSQ